MLIIHPKSLSSVSCIECHEGEHAACTYSALNYFPVVCVATKLTLWAQLYKIIQLQTDCFCSFTLAFDSKSFVEMNPTASQTFSTM